MFDEILGLPAHPLIIHAAVVLTPLAVLMSIAYAVVPRWRDRIGWAVVLLAVAAPVSVFAAKQSGEALYDRMFGGQEPPAQMAQLIGDHSAFANPLLFSTLGLGAASLVMVFLPQRAGKAAGYALSALTVVLAVVAGFYVARAGHTGATAVWSS